MDDFTTYYASLLDGAYTCVDRIVVDAYYPLGQTAGGFRTWWRTFQRDDELTTKHLLRFAARFSRSARAWAREHGIPVIFCRKGVQKVRMHKVAEAHLPKDPSFRGVFLVLVSREPGPVWQVGAFPSGAMDLRARQPWPYVHYYYFHLIDPDWGTSPLACAVIRRFVRAFSSMATNGSHGRPPTAASRIGNSATALWTCRIPRP